jgi:hypothetical protein
MTAPAPPDPFAKFKTGASYIDPITGQSIEGAASAPPGTPFYQSAPLVQNADGSTRSTGATAGNQFAGYVDAVGGGFGPTIDPATGKPIVDDPNATGAAAGTLNGQPVPEGMTLAQATANQVAQDDVRTTLANPLTAQAAKGASSAWFDSLGPADQQAFQAAGITRNAPPESTAAFLAANPTLTAAYQNAHPADGALAPAAPAAAPDPFGRFDSPTAASHVITPATEAAGAQAAQSQLLADTQPGAIAPSPGASATTSSATPVTPGIGITAVDPFAAFTTPGSAVPPVGGVTPPVTPVQSPTFTPTTGY